MKAFLALVWHELRERRALLAAAAVASLLPLLAPLLPSTGSNPAEDIREGVMWVIVGGLAPLFALLLGVSFIGRDLAEGRIGFFYAQPLSAPTIWFGKLTAVVLLVWAVEAIVMLPTILLAPDPRSILGQSSVLEYYVPEWLVLALFLGVGLAIVLVAHAVGVIWRARSAWLVVDFVALLVVAVLAWLSISPFFPLVAPDIALGAAWWVVGWCLVGLVVAGTVQVAAGRVDPKRCHRVLSTTLWTILVVSTGALLSWSAWVRSADLDDLDGVDVLAMGPGDWIAVWGTSAGRFDYRPRFLLNLADGRSVTLGPGTGWARSEVWLADDGHTAVWLEPDGFLSWTILSADLSVEGPQPRSTGVTIGSDWEDVAIAPDGSRFAALEGRMLAVYRGLPAEQLAATHIPEPFIPFAIEFDDSDTVRVLAASRGDGPSGSARWWLIRFDVATPRLTEWVEIPSTWDWDPSGRDIRTDHPLTTIAVGDERHLAIRDPATGEVVRDLGVRRFWEVRLLGDGRILVLAEHDGDDRLEILLPSGEMVATIDLPEAAQTFAAGMIAPERLLVGLVDRSGEGTERREHPRTVAVDLRSGSWSLVSDEHLPVLGRWSTWTNPGAWEVGSTASRLLRGEDGSLELLDAATGELRRVLPVAG